MIVTIVERCPVCGEVHSLPDARSFDREKMGCDILQHVDHIKCPKCGSNGTVVPFGGYWCENCEHIWHPASLT